MEGPVAVELLGPVRLRSGGDVVPLRSLPQRVLLARLALAPGRVVGVSELVDALWGGDPPADPVGNLHSYVSRLRRLVGTDRIERRPAGRLPAATRPGSGGHRPGGADRGQCARRGAGRPGRCRAAARGSAGALAGRTARGPGRPAGVHARAGAAGRVALAVARGVVPATARRRGSGRRPPGPARGGRRRPGTGAGTAPADGGAAPIRPDRRGAGGRGRLPAPAGRRVRLGPESGAGRAAAPDTRRRPAAARGDPRIGIAARVGARSGAAACVGSPAGGAARVGARIGAAACVGARIGAAARSRRARELLNDGGLVVAVEPWSADRLEDAIGNPSARIDYSASTSLCTPGSLFQPGGYGLGTQGGPAKRLALLAEAGFRDPTLVADTGFNLVLAATK